LKTAAAVPVDDRRIPLRGVVPPPHLFATVLNATGDLAAAVLVARSLL